MALGTRELELVIIARDHASASLARIGGALTLMGAAAARVGFKAIGGLAEMTNESIEFRRQIALAFTQAEIQGLEFNDVLNLVRDTAKTTAVPIDDLAESTFDIFSTLTLDNIGQASGLLDTFAESAVAGQAPIRDIGRAAIAWLNALDLAPTVENATDILEAQFELVRKGAGTYTEFADVIGKAIPPFVAANQGVTELSGSIAFLTRNGLSAAEAATSASRAVELLFGAKAIKGLKKVGISTVDAEGNFRKIDDLLGDVTEHFKDLNDEERKLEFKNIFGQGRIQARRFFDLILREGNFEEFLFLMGEVRDRAGNVGEALDIMTQEPGVQLDMLKNRFAVLRQEIGDRFIPFLVNRLMPIIDRLIHAWDDLTDIQKDSLVWWAAFGAVFTTVGGVLTAIGGSFILILGLLKAFTGSLGLAVLLGSSWALAIGAIAAAISLAIVDWDKFVEIFGPWWEKILDKMEPVADWLEDNWPAAWEIAKGAYQGALLWFQEEWPRIWQGFKDDVSSFLENDWPRIWSNVETAVNNFVQFFVDLWNDKLKQPLLDFIEWVKIKWEEIWGNLKSLFENFVAQDWSPLWDQIVEEVGDVLPKVIEFITSFAKIIIGGIAAVVFIVMTIWDTFGINIIEGIRIIIEFIGGAIETLITFGQAAADIIAGVFTLDPGLIVKGIAGWAEGIGTGLDTVVTGIEDGWKNTVSAGLNFADAFSANSDPKLFDEWIDQVVGDIEDRMHLPGQGGVEIPVHIANDQAQLQAELNALRTGIFVDPLTVPVSVNPVFAPGGINFTGDIISNADPAEVAEEIAWKLNTGGQTQS